VKTDAAGVVTSVDSVVSSGRDYATEAAMPSEAGSGWVLDAIDGEDPDPANPAHFDQFKDRHGENSKVMLNGAGTPATTSGEERYRRVEMYRESNFLSLGIPTVL
jgi:hypothetical protein